MDPTFREVLNSAMPDVVVTNYICVAEVVNEHGTEMMIVMSDGITPWLATGMLECAKDLVRDTDTSVEDEDDNEGLN